MAVKLLNSINWKNILACMAVVVFTTCGATADASTFFQDDVVIGEGSEVAPPQDDAPSEETGDAAPDNSDVVVGEIEPTPDAVESPLYQGGEVIMGGGNGMIMGDGGMMMGGGCGQPCGGCSGCGGCGGGYNSQPMMGQPMMGMPMGQPMMGAPMGQPMMSQPPMMANMGSVMPSNPGLVLPGMGPDLAPVTSGAVMSAQSLVLPGMGPDLAPTASAFAYSHSAPSVRMAPARRMLPQRRCAPQRSGGCLQKIFNGRSGGCRRCR